MIVAQKQRIRIVRYRVDTSTINVNAKVLRVDIKTTTIGKNTTNFWNQVLIREKKIVLLLISLY